MGSFGAARSGGRPGVTVSLAQRFSDVLSIETGDDALDELLPVHLARTAAKILGADGVGVGVQGEGGWRTPLGASDEMAATAERLQFTAGSGPCLLAAQSGWPVFGVDPILPRRWPAFHDLLVTQTPYRSIVALPLREELTGLGVLSLYICRSDGLATIDAFEARAVAQLISARLRRTAAWSSWSDTGGPGWMNSPAAQRRAKVWQAMGMVMLALSVSAEDALAVLRCYAYGAGREVDAVAADLTSGRISISQLGAGTRP
jgi:hypothetical protein